MMRVVNININNDANVMRDKRMNNERVCVFCSTRSEGDNSC